MKSLAKIPILTLMICLATLVSVPVWAASTDTLSINSGSGMPGTGGHLLQIDLTNDVPVRGIILKIADTPEAITVTDVATTSRTTTFKVYSTTTVDNGTRILITPYQTTTDKDIIAGVGEIVDLTVSVGADAEVGTMAILQIDSLTVVNDGKTTEVVSVRNGSFWIGETGNVSTSDGSGIDLFDVLRMIDIVLNRPPLPTEYELWAGDLDGDGDIDIVDIMDAIDIALDVAAPTPKTNATRVREYAAGSARIEFSSLPMDYVGETELSIDLSNSVPVSGMMLIFDLNTNKIQPGLATTTALTNDMVAVSRVNGRTLSVLLTSLSGKAIPAGAGRILNLPVQIREALTDADQVYLSKAVAGNDLGQEIETFIHESATTGSIPESFTLYQNNPNPFNMSTTISYDVPTTESGSVQLKLAIYNTQGQLVRVVENRQRTAGHYSVNWDGRNEKGHYVSSGVYFYKLISNQVVMTKKLAVMK